MAPRQRPTKKKQATNEPDQRVRWTPDWSLVQIRNNPLDEIVFAWEEDANFVLYGLPNETRKEEWLRCTRNQQRFLYIARHHNNAKTGLPSTSGRGLPRRNESPNRSKKPNKKEQPSERGLLHDRGLQSLSSSYAQTLMELRRQRGWLRKGVPHQPLRYVTGKLSLINQNNDYISRNLHPRV
jgi:hypothetical protein